jgi:hypothetical protein
VKRILALLLIVGCSDPAHDAEVEALGPEPQGETPGPLHRRGQPCLVCHGPDGPSEVELSVAGTIYVRPDDEEVVAGAVVTITDANGDAQEAITNEAGNFYLPNPPGLIFPLKVGVKAGDRAANMRTAIGRDGSCASCHIAAGDAWHMPRVYLEAP